MKKIQLSDNHNRSLSTSLYLIEKLADEFDRELNYKTELRMFDLIDDIPIERVEEYRSLISNIKKYIIYMSEKYCLKPNQLFHSRIINARRTKMWEILCDSKSKQMRKYGKFPDKHANEFDSDIDNLLNLISEV